MLRERHPNGGVDQSCFYSEPSPANPFIPNINKRARRWSEGAFSQLEEEIQRILWLAGLSSSETPFVTRQC